MKTQNNQGTPHIVIVGGGAGGLELATKLGSKLGKKNRAKVTLIDKNRVHIWKPLLHEVATGSLDTEIDGVVYRAHSARHSYHFQLGALSHIDRDSKTLRIAPILDENQNIVLEERTLTYDTLVLAIGSISNDFATPGVQEHCYMLDSKLQAQNFQKKLLNQFLKKSQQAQRQETISPTRLAIVGAGATGVELSAELNHVFDVVSVYDIDNQQGQSLEIDLIEAGPRILPALPEKIAESAAKELEKLNVSIHTSTMITQANEKGFVTKDGTQVSADLMVWAAGVKAQSWLAKIGLEVNRINQVICYRTLKSSNDSSIIREIKGKELIEFKYIDYGSLVNLSRFSTVGSLMGNLMKGSMFIEGKIARFMYLSLYRMHQLAIHGYIKGPFIILLSRISKIIRPKIKLH